MNPLFVEGGVDRVPVADTDLARSIVCQRTWRLRAPHASAQSTPVQGRTQHPARRRQTRDAPCRRATSRPSGQCRDIAPMPG